MQEPATDPTPNNPPADPPTATPPADPPAESAASSPAADASPPPADGTVPAESGDAQAPAGGEAPLSGDITPPPGVWPDDWRNLMAGGDPKLLTRLKRYASPQNIFSALNAAQRKISSGDLIAAKPDGEDAVAMNEWRASIGVPETPDGYLAELPHGLVIGEADKPYIDTFTAKMHDADMPPDAVHKALEWWHENEAQMAADRTALDETDRATCEDELHAEYGPDWPRYRNAVKGLFSLHGQEGLEAEIMSSRMADGQAFGSNTAMMKFLVNTALALNPNATATITPAAGKTVIETINAELAKLNGEMANKNGPYWKGPESAAMQARALELNQMLVDNEKKE